ncbi:S1 RNA-binding domain-containing protein [Desulfofundulus salinus]|uniref:S1 RNA-binding domain-containing protein n=1 Tax=Desulfofundulus salinus TaxID=2419843 RepID=A0A494X4H7_9FIRM|nr:S1 RNA-binding domain-containing protein [Desulfofundulus salinum]RKO67850.1 S1 RNA-binding domain-containing protein [Desulfofundulus salinum]
MPVEVGSVLEGVVTGIANFGAFVQLPGGETGLVHISEVANEYVKDINHFLKVNDRVTVKVISVDSRGKIGLSIRQARDSGERSSRRRRFEPSFEEKLSRFLKESEELQQSLRRSLDAKRGGRGSGRRFV